MTGRTGEKKPLLWACVVVATSLIVVSAWSDDLVERTLLGHAESSAMTWRTEFTNSVPDLPKLLDSGQATPEQRGFVEASMAGSDIFRFELFDSDGYLAFLSDEVHASGEQAENFNETALRTVRSGDMRITVEDGRDLPNRPDWYVEAYMPIADDGGTTIGVVEVYVDVTGLATALRSKFNWLSLVLLGATAIVYVVPTLLLINRNNQLRERDRQLLSLSKRDPLTGLMNRGAFSAAAAELFASRSRDGGTLGMLFIDLDKFKDVNDALGHEAGDQLITHVGDLLATACRTGDIVARIGGDEFVMLCADVDGGDLQDIADRLMLLAARPFIAGTKAVYPSFSIGMHLSLAGETESEALVRADLAVYRAKANGRGQAVMFTPDLEEQARRRRSVADDIRNALAEDAFFLEFQPIFNRSLALSGFETLLRLRRPDGTLIDPAEFIPIAEDIGVFDQLADFVLHGAMEAAADWPSDLFVAINMSAHQFRSGKLIGDVADALRRSSLDPARVCLELKETMVIDHCDATAEQLVELKAMGLQIAIDDFGTGYSGLGALWRYRCDRIAIDKSFLDGFGYDGGRYGSIIETIVVLGHQLDLSVTIKGIERQAQLDAMLLAGCDLFQGFLMSKPVSREEADRMARAAGAVAAPKLLNAQRN